jgi:exosortase
MDLATFWRAVPNAGVLLCWLVAWAGLFQFWGNSTLGYVKSPSLFRWWWWTMSGINDQELAYVMPAIVLGLIWWRREDIAALPKRIWWPGLALFLLATLLHVLGYRVQQARVSVVAFFAGIYALTGLLWGWSWLRAALFPFALLVFCVPLGSGAEPLTVPLRLLATKITAIFCHALGVNVVHQGNLLFDAAGDYKYEVAAACSGIKSLTTIMAFGVICGYVSLNSAWRRILVVGAAIPMAVAANVCRLLMIILASETFGHRAGDYVHKSSWLSLVPYIPAFGGIGLVIYWLRENRTRHTSRAEPALLQAAKAESKS